MIAKVVNGPKYAIFVIMVQDHPDHTPSIRAGEQPIRDLPHDGWIENRYSARCIEQTEKAQGAVFEGAVEICNKDTTFGGLAGPGRIGKLTCNGAQGCEVEFKDDSQIRFVRACFRNCAETGHLDAHEHSLSRTVLVTLGPEDG